MTVRPDRPDEKLEEDMDGLEKKKLVPGLSMTGAWAFAVGVSMGWGSLVVTSSTYLARSGPAGSILGLAAGAIVMLIIGRNYAYLTDCFPGPGGAYTYCSEALGYDHGFLCAWFLILTYLSILCANATSLPLFARLFLGDVFRFGKLYTLFGYEVYLGEVILSTAVTTAAALICSRMRKLSIRLMLLMTVLFTAGITVCFAGAVRGNTSGIAPVFIPDRSALSQIAGIALISPWAFVGFESISHAAEEMTFPRRKTGKVLVIAVITTTLLYAFTIILSVTAFPPEYAGWTEYIADIGDLQGIKALPACYAAEHYMGKAGTAILMLSLLALILTSLIGNIFVLSRLLCALSRDGVIPERYSDISEDGSPRRSIALVCAACVAVMFIGRTAIGWIVDVTNLGAVLVYALVSVSAVKTAKFRNDRTERSCGIAGIAAMSVFGLFMLIPSLISEGTLCKESLFLFVVWSVLGFLAFRIVLRKDEQKRFGKSIVVWIALLSLILFVSLVWMNRAVLSAAGSGMTLVEENAAVTGTADGQTAAHQLELIRRVSAGSTVVVMMLFALSLGVLLNSYNMLSKRAANSERQTQMLREIANRDALTGVKSKYAYTEKEKELDRQIEAGTAGDFAIAICDVNGLKAINDTMGHQEGDKYLKESCRLICDVFDHSPVYRIGGDEFLALLTGGDYEGREELIARINDISVANIGTDGPVISAGASRFVPGEDRNTAVVFARADSIMYAEKKRMKELGASTRI